MFVRTFLTLLFFSGVFFFPWYIVIMLALALLIVSVGYEVVFGGVLLDMLYAQPVPEFLFDPFIFSTTFFVCAVVAYIIKRRLMFYTDRMPSF